MGLDLPAMEALPTPPFRALFTEHFSNSKLHHSIELVTLILMHTMIFSVGKSEPTLQAFKVGQEPDDGT